jgi:hypothetical protein
VVLFLLLCQVLDSKEVLHLDMEGGMRLVLLEACIPLLLVLACKGVGAPPQVIRICHLLLEHGALRYSAETHMTLMTTSDCPTAGSGFHRCSCKHNVGVLGLYWCMS